MNKATYEMIRRLESLGISSDDAWTLRRIAMTLHRWSELECGNGNNWASWCIERDEKTGRPFMGVYPHAGKARREPIPDRETGALNRLARIIGAYPDLWSYHQRDPRGASLYIGRKADVEGRDLESCYTCGVAIYK